MKLRTLRNYSPELITSLSVGYRSGRSIPTLSKESGLPLSTVRCVLIANDVPMRNHIEAADLIRHILSQRLMGKKRIFSESHKQNMRDSFRRIRGAKARGFRITSHGYKEFTRGEHKGRAEHQIVMEAYIGRRLLKHECVHHKDENRLNNKIDNLQIMTRSEHTRHHRLNRKVKTNG